MQICADSVRHGGSGVANIFQCGLVLFVVFCQCDGPIFFLDVCSLKYEPNEPNEPNESSELGEHDEHTKHAKHDEPNEFEEPNEYEEPYEHDENDELISITSLVTMRNMINTS